MSAFSAVILEEIIWDIKINCFLFFPKTDKIDKIDNISLKNTNMPSDFWFIFIKLVADQPDNFQGVEHCLHMYLGDGLWNDINCELTGTNQITLCEFLLNF